MKRIAITDWCQNQIRHLVSHPRFAIDATAGTGRDTAFLCELLGPKGRVLAFDIQKEALDLTRDRLTRRGLIDRASLIQDGHEHMDSYADEESADLIMFNLGYLPGGDHEKMTHAATTIEALTKSLSILKEGGVLSLMIYSGGDSGFDEKDKVMAWLKRLDPKVYTVLVEDFYNKENHPPLPVFIFK